MKLIYLLSLLAIPSLSLASDFERIELSNYLRELNKIDRIIESAKESQVKGEPVLFKYPQFENDLLKIKQGIQSYLDVPNRYPRLLSDDIKPLSGEYH